MSTQPDAAETWAEIDRLSRIQPNDEWHAADVLWDLQNLIQGGIEALTSGRAAEYMRVGRAALKMQAEGGTQVLLADLIEEANK